jgi:hypothetical protein
VKKVATSNSNQTLVPQAKQLLSNMKYEVATEIGVNLKQGYNGDISSREAGRVGGNMVKKLIQYAETSMPGGKF